MYQSSCCHSSLLFVNPAIKKLLTLKGPVGPGKWTTQEERMDKTEEISCKEAFWFNNWKYKKVKYSEGRTHQHLWVVWSISWEKITTQTVEVLFQPSPGMDQPQWVFLRGRPHAHYPRPGGKRLIVDCWSVGWLWKYWLHSILVQESLLVSFYNTHRAFFGQHGRYNSR